MNIWFVSLIGLLVGVVGTGLGSFIGIYVKKTDKILSFLLGLTGGFMMFIVSFHLFPEAFYLGGILNVILGVLIGVSIIIILEFLIEKIEFLVGLRSGVLLALSIAIHNMPEGLALGSTLVGVSDFGFILTFAMLLHNIPEGISMALPLSMNEVSPFKIMWISFLAGVPTGIGAYIGSYLGTISNGVISICLAIAGGIMLYIVCDDLIPTGKQLHKGRVSSLGVIGGFILGIILYFR
ncbi:ZIP family metal transporter [Tissierella pigra]|uniref:ZIP family metal transporter n=1 Tax=Tissierella pigra TaxID=2607614 RepID=UPI001C0FA601|nr:ZIP family metal transporter [Tissierella pigra]MBU5427852.1 ZIP family metal transporter [Tissierella pigra]